MKGTCMSLSCFLRFSVLFFFALSTKEDITLSVHGQYYFAVWQIGSAEACKLKVHL